jgi:hypothetical protein
MPPTLSNSPLAEENGLGGKWPTTYQSIQQKYSRSHSSFRSVNVTSLSVPDARLDLDSAKGPPLPDPRVIVTTYDLQWPNATETLNETAIRLDEQFGSGGQVSGNSSAHHSPICMSVADTLMWPNVTNKLHDSKDGDCEAALGKECVAALLTSLTLGGGGCQNPNPNIDACQGVFNTGNFGMFATCKSTRTTDG